MKRLFSLLFLLSAITLCHADDLKFTALNPETVNARSVNFEKFKSLLIVYRIQAGADNIIEAYRMSETDDGFSLDPVGAFRENTVRDYRPLDLPSAARIEGIGGPDPKFVSNRVTYLLDMKHGGQSINYQNKEMLLMYADFLDHPEQYPGLDPSPIPGHVAELREMYVSNGAKQRAIAKEQIRQHTESLSNANRWFSIAMILPLGLIVWLLFATSGYGIAVGFHGKIRSVALVELLTLAISVASIISFPLVNWPYIVLGAALILVCAALILILSLRVRNHISFARHGSFPTFPALSFGIFGMFCVASAILGCVMISLNASGTITLSNTTGASDIRLGMILGILLNLAITAAFGFWYYKSLTSKAPQLAGSFIWIAISTIIAIFAALLLFLAIIAVAFIAARGKSSAGDSGNRSDGNGVGHNCSRCRNTSMGGCRFYPVGQEPAFNCPHYDPQ